VIIPLPQCANSVIWTPFSEVMATSGQGTCVPASTGIITLASLIGVVVIVCVGFGIDVGMMVCVGGFGAMICVAVGVDDMHDTSTKPNNKQEKR